MTGNMEIIHIEGTQNLKRAHKSILCGHIKFLSRENPVLHTESGICHVIFIFCIIVDCVAFEVGAATGGGT